ncbi:MAG TPA: Tm-1-like ATP-binding domain-containing protein [Gaiellaceae bacterium]
MATVVLLGTLDTKGREYDYLRARLREQGVDVILVDAGVFEPLAQADVTQDEVAAAAGADLASLREAGDRGAAVDAMCRGSAEVVERLHEEGRLDGILCVGGSGNSSIGAAAMRVLPVGVPKLLVSTVASGDTRPYMGATDVSMTYSVVDISGLNRISERILANAAGAIAGMARVIVPESGAGRPLIGATMFGVTTPAVTRARERLEELGYEVLVFHATGTGGQSMEALARGGFLAGVLDLTTTELADDLVGGVLSAGPDRLEVAGELGLPQVVSLGALDMVNFGPRETVPSQFEGRNIYVHNPTVTLMRTTPEECAELGRRIARKLSAAKGPTALFVPLKGVSMIATEGGPFHDAAADEALFAALREGLGENVELHELDLDVNDPAFADAMANRLHELISS